MKKWYSWVAAACLSILLTSSPASAIITGSADIGPGGGWVSFGGPYIYGKVDEGGGMIWEEGTILNIQGQVFMSPEDEIAMQNYLNMGYYVPGVVQSWGWHEQGLGLIEARYGAEMGVAKEVYWYPAESFTSDFSQIAYGEWFDFSVGIEDYGLYPPLGGTDLDEVVFPTWAHIEWTITGPDVPSTVPEPASILLFSFGILGVFYRKATRG